MIMLSHNRHNISIITDSSLLSRNLELVDFPRKRFIIVLLGLRLIQTQNAMRVASATAERKLRASLS